MADAGGQGCKGLKHPYGDGQYQEELGFDDPGQSKRCHKKQQNNAYQ
jgi:hypothetical protein